MSICAKKKGGRSALPNTTGPETTPGPEGA